MIQEKWQRRSMLIPKAEIEKAFEMLEDLKAGKKVDAEYKVPSVLVTKENVKEYMK